LVPAVRVFFRPVLEQDNSELRVCGQSYEAIAVADRRSQA
jgi:hypothetical protein